MPFPQETLERSARGDQSAFADLVREHQSMVFSLAYRFLRDRELAEDLAQEVFLHLYENLSAIQSPAHLLYYLRKVTTHRCIDHTRRLKHRPELALEDLPEPATWEVQPDPMMNDVLRKMVGALPEIPRMIITLRYQEDLQLSEIAEIMDLPLNTVKSHLRRSLALLREKLGRALGEVNV